MPSTLPALPHVGPRLRRAARPLAALAIAFSCIPATTALAADGSQFGSIGQYGELHHFGGFDSTWFDEGAYDGGSGETQPAGGKLIDPTGFAVDTQDQTAGGDGTAVYVLDRVSGANEETAPTHTRWRLQKLSDTGTPLGVTEFYLPDSGPAPFYQAPTGVEQLAIDDTTGRIYTLVYGTSEAGEQPTPYVEEVIGWSTTPTNGKLVAPGAASGGYPALGDDSIADAVSGYTKPGVLSDSSQVGAASIYDPTGIALDVTAGKDELAVVGDAAPFNGAREAEGPATVQQVSQQTGALDSSWSDSALAGEEGLPARGIFTTPSGDLDVALSTAGLEREADDEDVVDLHPDLSSPSLAASPASTPAHGQEPEAPLSDTDVGFGSPIVELSNGLFSSSLDENTNGTGYWEGVNNEGIRLVQPETGGLLSNPSPPATSIFDTLGGGACAISDEGGSIGGTIGVVLAAGAGGSVWALTEGVTTARFEVGDPTSTYTTDRQIVDFAPGASGQCANPSGTFSVANAAGGSAQPASSSSPLTVPAGSTVDFDAATIGYPTTSAGPQGYVYAYEWNLTGATSGGPNNDGYTIVNDTIGANLRPVTTASVQYTTPGPHTVKLKLLGDFGEYDESGVIDVQSTNPPTAAFTTPSGALANQAVTFDASGSQPASGAQIADYHWSFGDGQSDDTQSPTDTHSYAAPGTYSVTLTVRDNDNRASAPLTQQLVVGGSTGTTTTTTTTSTSTSGAGQTVVVDHSATNVSPQVAESGGAVKITVSCPATKVSCAGTIQVKTASAVAAAAKAKAHKPKKAILLLGSTSFSLAGGHKATLLVKLSSRGAKLLKSDKKLKVNIVVSSHDSFGDPLTRTIALTLRAAAPKKSHK